MKTNVFFPLGLQTFVRSASEDVKILSVSYIILKDAVWSSEKANEQYS